MSKAKIKIGKDVIESLTLGMYENSLFIYREYIQNSADQIDKAVDLNLFNSINEGHIEIKIDKTKKSISFLDNATGIRTSRVVEILGNIAQSPKDREKDKGFRGIGRLGGLAYCDELIFETSHQDEAIKSIMKWDAKQLKEIINNRKLKIEAGEVIEKITTFFTETEKVKNHYFKVTLINVNNYELLDEQKVKEYLSMVAPVAFSNKFIFKKKIYEELKLDNLSIDEYNIFVNTEQIFKAYTTYIHEGFPPNCKTIDEILDIEFIKIYDERNKILAWGWFGLTTFVKQIPASSNLARGIRLRKSNIQIGSENTLVKFHKEQRGNGYFLGEIYAISKNLIPNARRDYFLDNEDCKLFEQKIKNIFYNKLYKLYHKASQIRSAQKKIEKQDEIKLQIENKNKIGYSSTEEREEIAREFEKRTLEAQTALKRLEKIETQENTNEAVKKIFNKIVDKKSSKKAIDNKINQTVKIKYRTQNLSKLSKNERKFLSKIFTIIDKVLTPDLAENLKTKIEKEFI